MWRFKLVTFIIIEKWTTKKRHGRVVRFITDIGSIHEMIFFLVSWTMCLNSIPCKRDMLLFWSPSCNRRRMLSTAESFRVARNSFYYKFYSMTRVNISKHFVGMAEVRFTRCFHCMFRVIRYIKYLTPCNNKDKNTYNSVGVIMTESRDRFSWTNTYMILTTLKMCLIVCFTARCKV